MNFRQEWPGHWDFLRVRNLVDNSKNGAWGGEPGSDEQDVPCIRVADFDYGRLRLADSERTIRSVSRDQLQKLLLQPGDLLIEKSGGGELTPVGRVIEFSDESDSICSNFVARIRPTKIADNRYLLFLFAALYQSTYAHRFIKQNTGIQNLDEFALFDARVAVPDLDTQRSIAAYLDRETARIDQLIAKKERQVALLDQRARQAVSEIVIGQGSETGPSFTTGLDYVPRLPANWTLKRAGHLFQQVAEPNTDDLPVLSVSIHSGISDRQLDDEERDRKVNLIEDRSSYKRVRPGYLAYNMMRAWQGAVGVSTVEGAVSPAYVVAKPTRDLHSPYYQFLLRTPPFIEQMRQGSKGIADFRLRLYWEQFRLIMLPVPPLDEQKRIAIEAEYEITHAAEVAAKVRASIERLKERRAALITAAVTGQIDVRQQTTAATIIPDRNKFRLIVGAEIVHRHQGNPRFGRVKLQKELYLAEAHVGISELQGSYMREAAGPLDRALIDETERALGAGSFYGKHQPDGTGTAVTYTPLSKAGQHVADLKALLGPRADALRNLISLLNDLDRRQVEAVATLYAVWNDALLDGQGPDEAAIIKSVLTEWHAEKGEKFKQADLELWLGWMKRHCLIPQGQGPRTAHTMTQDMFS
jgi:restriction endonuclease S subunit